MVTLPEKAHRGRAQDPRVLINTNAEGLSILKEMKKEHPQIHEWSQGFTRGGKNRFKGGPSTQDLFSREAIQTKERMCQLDFQLWGNP